ncbi:hypothetical protein FGG08_002063 [Glutinoglossum americanum]|uniref:Orotidine 5'-phosphate decarboxylase n=1 Tax=Glutinoglossum americanum TaxID=1670608 RepID=A0A9P8IDJ7_9PEZI|nr:hypothetical protein FGG08_002063 [Glutinoglossum americanum]
MASKSTLSYASRAKTHRSSLVKKLFDIAEVKKTNVAVSADLRNTKDLLALADAIGPYIAVFKTHIDLVSDFGEATVAGLKSLSVKHNFLFFEDRKFVDIGNTVQQQYHGGALRISEWAHIVNASVLAGEGIIEALVQTAQGSDFQYKDERALLILAEMTTKGSLATGAYTSSAVEIAKRHQGFVIGFVATRSLESVRTDIPATEDEDFVIFTAGVNRSSKGDKLGQQYQTPKSAIERGSDFIIAGRGIYASEDPVASVKLYQEEGWQAYLARIGSKD